MEHSEQGAGAGPNVLVEQTEQSKSGKVELAWLTFSCIVAHSSYGGFEVGRCILLQLVGKWVNFEAVKSVGGRENKDK